MREKDGNGCVRNFKVDNDGVEYTQDEIFTKVIKRRYDSCLKIWSTRNSQMICAMNVFFFTWQRDVIT